MLFGRTRVKLSRGPEPLDLGLLHLRDVSELAEPLFLLA